ncbi:Fibronectin type III domain-containing protein [Nakamurella panacisegetis]|uniref:Fibronectin type III domain-containing protein n=1 Tax=Nakamurella panacisegetis TaxID=1090615 RepID=A0A1H0J8R8_9ACTN|nr:fibronectin type III domain-containing protein [Nakamurella panacisegetis]SDO40106.1 Fibronectin type III domain-containing protein [Nakamurella panacisegetis]
MAAIPQRLRPALSRVRRYASRIGPGRGVAGVCAVALVGIGVVAATQHGFAQQPPAPVNRSAWVLNADKSLVGRINPSAAELDSALTVRGSVALFQDPVVGTPLLLDKAAHELTLVDQATVTVGARAAVPDNAEVAIAGGVVAVADRNDGRLWFGAATAVASVDSHLVKQKATIGARPTLAVTTAGTVLAVAPGSDRITVGRLDGSVGTVPVAGGRTAGASPSGSDIQLTAVGETPVVLDRTDRTLRVAGHRFVLPLGQRIEAAVLQQPGPAASMVYLQTPTSLLSVDLDSGAVTTSAVVTGTAGAVRPVVAGGCVYAVWGGTLTAGERLCPGAPAIPRRLDGTTGASVLHLAAVGDVVTVNDSVTGLSFLASDDFRVVDNWNDVAPPAVSDPDKTGVQNQNASDQTPPPPPSCTSVPIGKPHAQNDEYGVRAGRETVLRVLDNDPTTDCTSVVITGVSAWPASVGTVSVVAGGTALQVSTAPEATGVLPVLRYQVGNGRGGTAEASVTVTVAPPGESKAPVRIRRPAADVEAGATITYNVLDDYYSPVGDDLYLESAVTDAGDVVSFRPDGSITYRSTGTGIGSDRRVQFVVSDGRTRTSGVMAVSITDVGSSAPVSFPVYAHGRAGSTIQTDPTRTLTTASAKPVVISKVTAEGPDAGATATVSPDGRRISVSSSAAGTYYFSFEAATGDHATTGVLRADFTAGAAAAVPMVDVAYLPAGGSAVVDPLANDSDPAGAGLAVRRVDVPAWAGLTAAVSDLHLVRIESPRQLAREVTLAYDLYDGHADQPGQIRVVPVPATAAAPPPVATPISVTVRAGDAVTIPVADHAYAQDGTQVTAVLDAAEVAAIPGRAFSTGSEIRYLAPAIAPAGPITFGYTAMAASSTPTEPVQARSAVSITVVGADASVDRPPASPAPVVARVFAGGSITVALPLDGIDPDGDWVVTSSLQQPEAPLGSVSLSGADSLSYTAFRTPGVDRISYRVTDPYGKTAVGTATVLVVPPLQEAAPPIAPDLSASVRPGRSIRIEPLASVVDPGGRSVTFASPAFEAPSGVSVVRDGDGLVVTAPNRPTQISLRYNVINTQHLAATGAISLTVSKDAPVPPPEATDVFVPPSAIQAGAATVNVDVSDHVTNRSGRRDQLTISVDPVSATVAVMDGRYSLRVTLSDHRQVVAYRARNNDGGTATAFVVVPPRTQLDPPRLLVGAPVISLEAGGSVTVLIADQVAVATGTPQIAADPALRATQGAAIRLSANAFRLTAPATAGGAAVVYVPINSGSGPPVVLGLAVTIVPKVIPAPQLDNTLLPVEVGQSAQVDLRPLTTTFDTSQAAGLVYSAGATPAGVTDSINGSVLTVTVPLGVPRGTEFTLPVQVTDDQGKIGRAVVTARATGSRKPLATLVSQHISGGRGGVPVTADVLTGSSDPIGLGLTVGSVKVTAGAAGVRSGPTLSGSKITVVPSPGYVGDIVIGFQVTDGTKDQDRAVAGTLTVTTQDVPSAPGTPSVVAGTLSAHSVELTWAAADPNGAPITGYTVSGNGISQTCPGNAPSCRLDGLQAGDGYRFSVIAHNAIGNSPPSPVSAAVVPDALPAAPAAPVAAYLGRGTVRVTWTQPTGDFTPVTTMTLREVIDGTVVATVTGRTSPFQASGLDSASQYQFQVRATNAFGDGPWSELSAPVIPSGVPAAPIGVVATYLYDGSMQRVRITWSAPPDDGGVAVSSYRLLQDGLPVDQHADSPTIRSVSGTAPVTFSVAAMNSRGVGPESARVVIDPWITPTAPGPPQLTPGDTTVAVGASGGTTPGSTVRGYQYQVGGGGWRDLASDASAVLTGLTNGHPYSVAVRVCNTESGPSTLTCSPASPSVTVTPFGPPGKPVITDISAPDSAPTTVTVRWTWPDSGGRPVGARTVTIKVGGTEVAGVDAGSGTWTGDAHWGTTVTADARFCVTDPATCTDADQKSYSTPPVFSYQVDGGSLGGTCAASASYGGDWVLDRASCDGTWQPNGTTVQVRYCRTGATYNQDPGDDHPVSTPPTTGPTTPTDPTTPTTPTTTTSPPTSSNWYVDVDGLWYRAPALTGSGASGC